VGDVATTIRGPFVGTGVLKPTVVRKKKAKKKVLQEKVLSSEDRERMRSSTFGIPKERKFPLNDAEHVRNAIARFKYAKEDERAGLARRIRAAARKFGVEIGDDSLVKQY